jgi:hypothetical protein
LTIGSGQWPALLLGFLPSGGNVDLIEEWIMHDLQTLARLNEERVRELRIRKIEARIEELRPVGYEWLEVEELEKELALLTRPAR